MRLAAVRRLIIEDASEKEPLDFKGRLEKLKNRCEHLC